MQVATRSLQTVSAPPRSRASWSDARGVLVAFGVANALLLSPLLLELRFIGALALFVALPGYLFVQAVFADTEPALLERWLLAIGCGFVSATLLSLALYVLVRPLSTPLLVLAANALNAGLLVAVLARGAAPRLRLGRPHWSVLLVLAVAAPLRLLNLGYSEFQGDEAKVVFRTAALLQGVPDVLSAHYRPPGEILLSASFAGGLGAITELHARLPFALAGLAGVLAVSHLARLLFGLPAGLAAGLLLAVNGYFVAFGRTLQYPSLVLLLDSLALLCLYRFAQGSGPAVGYAVVGALLLAGSALSALSAVFLLPVAAIALWPRLVGRRRLAPRVLAVWLWPLALLPILALAYLVVPRLMPASARLPSAAPYLTGRLGERELYFNLGDFLASANHYTSGLYLLVVLGAALLLLLSISFQPARRLARNGRHRWGDAGVRLVLVWTAAPLLTHLLVVQLPQTHWREVFPGLILVAAAAVGGLYSRLATRAFRLGMLLAGGLFLAAVGHFVYVSWLQPWPEYQLRYPDGRHPLDWARAIALRGGVQTEVPRYGGGVYGAAHHHGWKTVAELMASGALPSEYETNEREAVSAWYLKLPRACPSAAQLYIHAPNTPQARALIERGRAPPEFSQLGQVQVGGQPMLALSLRERASRRPATFQDTGAAWFDRERTSPWDPIGELYRSESPRRC